ncbi:TolC family protein, partial [bacterium]|nr:TolC family protein [bacterium]
SLSLQRDNIILDVRQTYRAVVRARNSVQIDRTSVDLAARRVDNTRTRLEAARAETRDVLLATRSLLTTKNQLTRALVAHEMARLELWLSTEELRVDEKGMWAEVEQPARGDEDVEARERSEAEEKELAES